MRIAVNSLSLRPTPSGIGQYTRQLFSAMGAPAAPPEIASFYGLNWSRAMAEARAPALDSGWRLGRGHAGGRPLRRLAWLAGFGIGARRGGFEAGSEFVRGELLGFVSALPFLGRAGPMVTCTAVC